VTGAPGGDETAGSPPLLQVVKGSPTDEELAALVCVLLASSGGRQAEPPAPEKRWGAYWRNLRAPLVPGPSSWLGSGRLP
jgi:hypothetical protein